MYTFKTFKEQKWLEKYASIVAITQAVYNRPPFFPDNNEMYNLHGHRRGH